MKKKKSAERNWATSQLSCEKKKNFVLQPCNCIAREKGAEIWNGLLPNCIAKRKGFCIAIQLVYCKWERLEWLLKIVLQYNYCIAGWKVA